MKIQISAGWVSIESGRTCRTMALDQYKKHCADSAFAAAMATHHDTISKATPATVLSVGENIVAAPSPLAQTVTLAQRILDTATA